MPTTTDRKGKQRRRERRALVGLLAGLAGLLILAALWIGEGLAPPARAAGIGGPFRLIGADGKAVTDADLHGRYLLVYFGYTSCPDVCPTTLQNVAGALDRLGAKADRLQALFISVDPARDTPKAVGQYAAAFSPRLMGLTGTPEAVGAVEKEYQVYVATHRYGPGPDDYSVDHSSVLYLMGPDGRFVARLRADAQPADLAEALSHDIS
jgi:protein SCO1/2